MFFLLITSPVAGFLISKVAYMTGTKLWKHSLMDELKDDLEKESNKPSKTEKES